MSSHNNSFLKFLEYNKKLKANTQKDFGFFKMNNEKASTLKKFLNSSIEMEKAGTC